MPKVRLSRKNQKGGLKKRGTLNNLQPKQKQAKKPTRRILRKPKKTVSFNDIQQIQKNELNHQTLNKYKSIANRTPTPHPNAYSHFQIPIHQEESHIDWKKLNESIVDDDPPEKKEKILNELNKGDGKTIYGYFWMDGCGHCDVLHPIWENVVDEMRVKHPNYFDTNFKSENVKEASSVLTDKYKLSNPVNVEGFPTIFLIKDNNLKYHNGDRSKDSIIKWVTG